LKYYIPYALVVEEKEKKKKKAMRACARAHTYTIGKKRKEEKASVCLLARSLIARARAQFIFANKRGNTNGHVCIMIGCEM
jgi:hypothetical protein